MERLSFSTYVSDLLLHSVHFSLHFAVLSCSRRETGFLFYDSTWPHGFCCWSVSWSDAPFQEQWKNSGLVLHSCFILTLLLSCARSKFFFF